MFGDDLGWLTVETPWPTVASDEQRHARRTVVVMASLFFDVGANPADRPVDPWRPWSGQSQRASSAGSTFAASVYEDERNSSSAVVGRRKGPESLHCYGNPESCDWTRRSYRGRQSRVGTRYCSLVEATERRSSTSGQRLEPLIGDLLEHAAAAGASGHEASDALRPPSPVRDGRVGQVLDVALRCDR